jgi:hypothetical protein
MQSNPKAGVAAVQRRVNPAVAGRDVIQYDHVGADLLVAESGFPDNGRFNQPDARLDVLNSGP